MFDSVGDALDKLRSLKKKKMESIDEHIAKFKMLAAESKMDMTSPLSIELFKETLPWTLTLELMKLETPLKTINDWYKCAATLDHQFHKVNRAIEQTRGNSRKERTPQQKYYFPRKEHDANAMDVDRLTVKERNKLMKKRRCLLQTIHLFFSSLTCVCLMPSIFTYLNTSLPAGIHESLNIC
jgi:hypothetical protein